MVGLGLGLGLDVAYGWLVVMHTYYTILPVVVVTLPEKIIQSTSP